MSDVSALIPFFDPAHLQAWLQDRGPGAALVFVILQAVQVVVFWIPSTPFEVAGGLAFGLWGGTVLSTLGLALGNLTAFLLARNLGKARLGRWFSSGDHGPWAGLVHHPRLDACLGVLFLLPYLPKDIFAYLAGLSDLKPWRFFWVTTLARIPSLILSSWIGDLAGHGPGGLFLGILALGTLAGPVLFLCRKPLLAALTARA